MISSCLKFDNGFVINPDKYYSPSFRISPFQTSDLSENFTKIKIDNDLSYFDSRFLNKKWNFTESGKVAIDLALSTIGLSKNDCVTILTTSGNKYISSCVTNQISQYCKYSRNFEKNTKAIFVNHEFGYPYDEMLKLKRFNLPIIEDACHSFLSDAPEKLIGSIGDFVIFSLPKIYPIQFGGVLFYSSSINIDFDIKKDSNVYNYLASVSSSYIPDHNFIASKRLDNYFKLEELFSRIQCFPRFKLLKNNIPGVFIFTVPNHVNLDELKIYGWKHGIECSVFYGEQAFFIPIHHRLSDHDLDYFFKVFDSFISH